MATLNLPDDTRTLVWRLILRRLQDDPTLGGVVGTWITWDGTPLSTADVRDVVPPALACYPVPAPMSWFDASAQRGFLIVALEAWLPGLDAEDFLNLQGAIERALYPDDADAFQRALVSAGALTGLVEFTQPLEQQSSLAGTSGGFRPLGTFQIECLRQLIH